MREGWTYKKLGEVCVSKNDIERASKCFAPSDVILYIDISSIDNSTQTMTDITKYVMSKAPSRAQQRVIKNDIVISTVRPNLKNIAIIDRCDDNLVASSGFCVLRVKKDVERNFIFYYVSSNLFTSHLTRLTTGANYPAVRDQDIRNSIIPVPPIPIQQSIVSELNKINELIALKKSQLKDLDSLAQSLFYEMFGDPITNEKGWEVKKLSDLSKEKLSYGSGASAIHYDGETRYVRITDINDNGDLNDDIVSPSVFDDKYLLNDGDILFARSGATVGKTYLHKVKDGKCLYAGYLIRFIPKIECVIPIYVFALTKTHYYRLFVSNVQRAVAQPNINAKQYGDLLIPLPPLYLQQSFANKIEAIEEQKSLIRQSLKDLETLLQSRMDYWFND